MDRPLFVPKNSFSTGRSSRAHSLFVREYENADDIYLPGAFASIEKTFRTFPEIEWLKGITSFIKETGEIYQHGRCFIYNQTWIQRGIYGRDTFFIQQDSVFWKKDLWIKSGGIDSQYKLAGDYYLWKQFAKYAPLWSLKKEVSCFRQRAGQLSGNMRLYRKEQAEISQERGMLTFFIKLFFQARAKSPLWLGFIYNVMYQLAFQNENPYGIEIDNKGTPVKHYVSTYILH